MSVSIQAMEDFATSLPEVGVSIGADDIGNIVEVGDLGDDLGMSLLANAKYSGGGSSNSGGISLNTSSSANRGTTMNVGPVGGFEEVDVTRMEPIEPIHIDIGGSASAPPISVARETSYQPANSFGVDGSYANHQSASGPSIQLHTSNPIKDTAEKADLINKLQRLEAKGFPVAKRFTMDNSLEEVKAEYTRLVDARQLETSIRFQRNMLMGVVNGMEWLNNRFDPFDLKLDGWSEGVHENIDDYDEIFEELYDKYKEKGKMPPEARLIFQLAGSGFMCHVTNTFFRSKMPSADDIFKNNPELAKQFAAAAAQQAAPGFGNFMGMAMGVPPSSQQAQQQQPPQQQMPQGVPLNQASGPGAFFNSPQHVAAQPPQQQSARREMRGPTGVDDILRTFEEVRFAEENGGMNVPMQPPMAMNNPAMAAAEELQSIASGDVGSIGTERTASGRRRRRQAPSGNVVSLNA